MNTVSLNYVWINAVPHNHGVVTQASHGPDRVECPIPQRCLEYVRAVRKKHPDIDISIWMDVYKRNDRNGDLSWAFAQATGLDGVTFRGLREIPDYRDNPLFTQADRVNKTVHGVIWKQVDLARLIVLKHQLDNSSGIQIYSDFDILEPFLDPDSLSKTSQNGFLVNRVPKHTPDIDDYDPYVHDFENNLFAFCGNSHFSRSLLTCMIQDTLKYYRFYDDAENGWDPFRKAFRDFKVEHLSDKKITEVSGVAKAQPRKHDDYPGFRV